MFSIETDRWIFCFIQTRVIGSQPGLRPVLESIFHRILTKSPGKGVSVEALKALKEVNSLNQILFVLLELYYNSLSNTNKSHSFNVVGP
jgi:hypothetical protein